MNKVKEFDTRDDVDDLDENKIKEQRELSSLLQDINMRNESLLQQKSRPLWFKQRIPILNTFMQQLHGGG